MLVDVPMKMGRAAKATIGDLVYKVLTDNPKLSDGKALFHANHKNIATGGISVSGLDAARQMMRLQKEGDRALNIRPAFMLVPVALETVANQTIKSASVKGADANAGVINPIQNFAEVIAEARLDAADPKTCIWRRHRALTPLKWPGWMVWTRHTLISRKVSPLTALPQKSVLMPEWHHLTGAGWCVRRWPDNRVITITARKGFFYA